MYSNTVDNSCNSTVSERKKKVVKDDSSRVMSELGFVPVGAATQRNGQPIVFDGTRKFSLTNLYRGLSPPIYPDDFDDLALLPWSMFGDSTLMYGAGLEEFRNLIRVYYGVHTDEQKVEYERLMSIFTYETGSFEWLKFENSEDLTEEDRDLVYEVDQKSDQKWFDSRRILREAMFCYLSHVKLLVQIHKHVLPTPQEQVVTRLWSKIAEFALVLQLTLSYIRTEFENDPVISEYLETIANHAVTRPEVADFEVLMWYYPHQAVGESLTDILSDVASYVTNWGKSAWACLCEYAGTVFSSLCGFFNTCLDGFKDLVKRLVSWMSDTLVECIDPQGKFRELLSKLKPKEWLQYAYPLGLLLAGSFGVFLGFISGELVTLALEKCVKLFRVYAESSSDWVMIITTVLAMSCSCLGDWDLKEFESCVRPITLAVNLATSSSKLWSSILMILPACLRRMITKVTGTDEDMACEDVNDFVAESKALMSLKKTPAIFKGDSYLDHLTDLVHRGLDLLGRLDPKNPRWSAVNNEMNQLVRAYEGVSATRYTNDRRAWPFWIHLYGEPGIGKTNVINAIHTGTLGHLINGNTGKKLPKTGKLWTRNASQGFFNGYSQDYDYIVYDDLFNAADTAMANQVAAELLAICSSVPYYPDMASLEPGVTGQKGVQFESSVLITASNSCGVPVSGDVERGILRRRNMVVNMVPAKGYAKYFRNNSWHLEESGEMNVLLRTGKHINFIIKTPYRADDDPKDRIVVLNGFKQLVDYIIVMQNDFAEQTLNILGERKELDIEETINKRILEFKGVIPPSSVRAQASKVRYDGDQVGRKYVSKSPFFFKVCEDGSFEILLHPRWYGALEVHDNDIKYDDDGQITLARLITTINFLLKARGKTGVKGVEVAGNVVEQLQEGDTALVMPAGLRMKFVVTKKCRNHMFESQFTQLAWLNSQREALDVKVNPEEAKAELEQAVEQLEIKCDKDLEEKALATRLPEPDRVQAVTVEEEENEFDFFSADSCEDAEGLEQMRHVIYNHIIEHYKDLSHKLSQSPIIETIIAEGDFFPVEQADMKKVNPSYKEWVKKGLYVGVALTALFEAGRFLYRTLCPEKDNGDCEYVQLQGRGSPSPTASAKPKVPTVKATKYVRKNKLVQKVDDESIVAEAKMIEPWNLEIGGVKTHGFFVKGHWFVTHKHLVLDAINDEPEKVYISKPNTDMHYAAEVNYDRVSSHDEKDIVVMEIICPKLPQFANCINLLSNRAMIERFCNGGKKWQGRMVINGDTYCGDIGHQPRQSYMCGMKEFYSKELAYYFFETKAGDCGSLLTSKDSVTKLTKVMGFHVAAGNSGGGLRGYAQLFSGDEIETLISKAIGTNSQQQGEFVVQQEIVAQSGVLVTPCPEYPNLIRTEVVPRNRQVFTPKKSPYEPSPLMGKQSWEVKKVPSVVDADDPRADGQDPLKVSFQTLASLKQPEVDDALLDQCAAELLARYKANVSEVVFRRLSREEAVGGIPGVLNSVNFDSSPGYPLCLNPLGPGKRPYAWKEGEECHITSDFNSACDSFLKYLLTGEREDGDEFYWLAFSKAELQKKSKVEEHRTRAIYAGSFIHNTVGRELFGCLLANINNHKGESFISCNQYSLDLGMMKSYLDEVKVTDESYIAGDYKNFDQHYVRKFQLKAYDILWGLMSKNTWVSKTSWDRFVECEVDSPVQYGTYRYWFNTQHNSGCLFTTIVNNLVNSMMMRYMFGLVYGHLRYDTYVRGIFLGDDHVLCVNVNACPDFNQQYLIDNFHKLGQIYTDDQKNVNNVAPYRRFEEITFLGSHPFNFEGLGWCGRIRKDTLEQNILYMKGLDSWRQTLQAMAEHCSLWDRDYFDRWMAEVNNALESCGMDPIILPYESRRSVALRTAESGSDFGVVAQGLTNYTGEPDKQDQIIPLSMPVDGSGMGGDDQDFREGTSSFLLKKVVTWGKSQSKGTIIASFAVPFGLLTTDGVDLQTTKMKTFQYMRSDFTLRFQTNGNAFQQGMLIAYFLPLTGSADDTILEDATANEHVMIRPLNSQDVEITVPYRFYYPYLRTNSMTGATSNESLGMLVLRVWSPLTYVSGSDVTVTMYMRMDDPVFKVPRPYGVVGQAAVASDAPPQEKKDEASTADVKSVPPSTQPEKAETKGPATPAGSAPAGDKPPQKPKKKNNWKRKNTRGGREFNGPRKAKQDKAKADKPAPAAKTDAAKAPAQGAKKNSKQKPLIVPWGAVAKQIKGRVMGGIPTEGGGMVNGKAEVKGHKNLLNELLEGMDNLNMSDINKTVKDVAVLTSALGFLDNTKVAGNNQKFEPVFDGMSKCVGDHLTTDMQLAPNAIFRPGRVIMDPSELNFSVILGKEVVISSFDWNLSNAENTQLFAAKLDSRLCSKNINLLNFVLDHFMFWHAKLRFKLYAMKTLFHTGRLRVNKQYGCNESDPNWRTSGYTDILDFTTDNDVCEFVVDWVARTDYLRTRDPGVVSRLYAGEDNYSMGLMQIEVANRLSVSNVNVSPAVNMILTLSLDEVRVAVPRPNPSYTCVLRNGKSTIPYWGFSKVEAQGLLTSEGQTDVGSGVEINGDDGEGMEGLLAGGDYLDLGAQFEFTVGSLLDYSRRFVECHKFDAVQIAGYRVLSIPVSSAVNDLCWLFRGFAGSLSFRIFFYGAVSADWVKVSYVPTLAIPVDYQYGILPPGTQVESGLSMYTNGCMPSIAKEMLYPLTATQQWIDVSVPYQQQTMFMPLQYNTGGSENFSRLGMLYLVIPASKSDNVNIKYYVKYGDDATCGIFRTPVAYSNTGVESASYGKYT
nr:MAG: polyprotein [stool-associated RNA virus]